MLTLFYTAKFKKDYKRVQRQGKNLAKLAEALDLLCREQELPPSFHDHALVGNYQGHRECHLEPDWLLIYRRDADKLILTASRTGSHSDLFNQ